ncbi:hypothetical protein [Flavobacterium sp.]|uniref:hypothetical protein n=1 Tax=Flavobacterium sp. TaxID=239 RepID=UPI00248A7B65|nr:hypothetical protein [Flavobacterium sp.]MDI1318166.1 hypothetical protein [Flavobacterium sp.]
METHNESTLNIVESHKNAALYHQEAAKSHLEAAKYHAGGEEIQANESAKTALQQSDQAVECEKEVKQHHGF